MDQTEQRIIPSRKEVDSNGGRLKRNPGLQGNEPPADHSGSLAHRTGLAPRPREVVTTAGGSVAVPALAPLNRASAYAGPQNNRESLRAISPGSAGTRPPGTPPFRHHRAFLP